VVYFIFPSLSCRTLRLKQVLKLYAHQRLLRERIQNPEKFMHLICHALRELHHTTSIIVLNCIKLVITNLLVSVRLAAISEYLTHG
jgi:hypothetical protein